MHADSPDTAQSTQSTQPTQPTQPAHAADSPAELPGLEPLGLTAIQEQVYRHLLAARGGSARTLSRALRLPATAVDHALERLSSTGLVRPAASDVPAYNVGQGVHPSGLREVRYSAEPPSGVLGDRLRRRAAELVQAGAAVEQLARLYARGHTIPAGEQRLGTVVEGAAAVNRAVHELLTETAVELLGLDRQPFVRTGRPHSLSDAVFDLLARGVCVRTIYAADAFRVAGYAPYMSRAAALGERSRLAAHLPLRFVVVDRSTAMLPLEADGPWVTAAVVVRGHVLVEDLVHTFEELWDHASPAPAGPGRTGGARPGQPDSDLSEQELTLLKMLANDMTESAIGRHVGASARTVGRRVARLQRKLGSRTRFGLGLEAARRGLL